MRTSRLVLHLRPRHCRGRLCCGDVYPGILVKRSFEGIGVRPFTEGSISRIQGVFRHVHRHGRALQGWRWRESQSLDASHTGPGVRALASPQHSSWTTRLPKPNPAVNFTTYHTREDTKHRRRVAKNGLGGEGKREETTNVETDPFDSDTRHVTSAGVQPHRSYAELNSGYGVVQDDPNTDIVFRNWIPHRAEDGTNQYWYEEEDGEDGQHNVIDQDESRLYEETNAETLPELDEEAEDLNSVGSRWWPGKHPNSMTLEELEEDLKKHVRRNAHPIPIRFRLLYLIKNHKVRPVQWHYEALILSNCHPAGSAEHVRQILMEMEDCGLDVGASTYEAALLALAIHPSPSLTSQILNDMERRWIRISPVMQHAQILSVIRTGQTELANSMLNDLHSSQKPLPTKNRTPIPKYLYMEFIKHLINDRKDFDAVIRFIYKLHDRRAVEMELPRHFWAWVLSQSAWHGDVWVTIWIWQDWVETTRVRPRRDTCHHVLRIAATHKLPWLAQSVKDTVEHGGVAVWIIDEARRKPSAQQNSLPLRRLTSGEEELIEIAEGGTPTRREEEAEAEVATAAEEEEIDDDASDYSNNSRGHDDFQPFHAARTQSQSRVENDTATTNTTRANSSSSSRNNKSKNMWTMFKDSLGYGTARESPWDALGPKSRP